PTDFIRADVRDPSQSCSLTLHDALPIWILGSSLYGAQLAAMFGLPYAFASHFAPEALDHALEIYRANFQPSDRHDRPYAMVAARSEEHTSELQSREKLVCRLLLEKNNVE